MRLIPILAAVTIGLFATAAVAQNRDPGSAPPGVSASGGKPQPVDPNEVKRDNTPVRASPLAPQRPAAGRSPWTATKSNGKTPFRAANRLSKTYSMRRSV